MLVKRNLIDANDIINLMEKEADDIGIDLIVDISRLFNVRPDSGVSYYCNVDYINGAMSISMFTEQYDCVDLPTQITLNELSSVITAARRLAYCAS